MSHYAPFASLKSRSTSAGDSIRWLCTRLEFWWEVSLEHVLTIENPWAFFHPNLHLPKRYLTRSRKETNLRGQSRKEWANSSSNPQDLKKKDAGWRYKSPSGRPRCFGLQETPLGCQVCRNASSDTPTKVHNLKPVQQGRFHIFTKSSGGLPSSQIHFMKEHQSVGEVPMRLSLLVSAKAIISSGFLAFPEPGRNLQYLPSFHFKKNGIIDFIRTHSETWIQMVTCWFYMLIWECNCLKGSQKKKKTLSTSEAAVSSPVQP